MKQSASPSEKVDVFELSRTRARLAGRVEIAAMPRLAAMLAAQEGGLDYEIEGMVDRDGHPGARMSLSGGVAMSCNRCGKPVAIAVERDVPFRFVRSEAEANAIPIEEDEEVEIIVGSAALELAAWVEEEAILSLPLAPRHEDCPLPAGPEAAFEIESEAPRKPFAVLETLKRGK